MTRYRLGLFALVTLVLAACHDEHKDSAVGRGQFCTQGGATLSAVTNECQCPSPQKWNGAKCDGAPAVSTVEPKPETMLPEPQLVPPTPAPPAAPAGLTALQLGSLKQACVSARAEWLDAEQFCQCPDGKVLVGDHCRVLHGRVTAEACSRAVVPGKWKHKDCFCEGTDTFVPQRGGCIPPARDLAAVQKLSCESSLDSGHWDTAKKRCDCPKGRIWVDELCEIQTRMGSALICQSDYHRGTWDWDHKRCSCPSGELWLNQACLDPHSLPQHQVCESEWNKGQWNASAQTCSCPKGKAWDTENLVCSR